MGEHQRVLDEGLKGVGGYGSAVGGREQGGALQWGNFNPKDYPRLPGVSTQWVPRADNVPLDDSPFAILPTDQISEIVLKNSSELYAAECYARVYESTGDFDSARKLYLRVLGVRKSKFNSDPSSIQTVEAALARVEMFRDAGAADRFGNDDFAVRRYTRVIDTVDRSKNLDLKTKQKLLNRVISLLGFDPVKNNLEAIKQSKRASQLCDGYKRAMQCLGMADALTSTAFKLEVRGSYELSEKLFRDALAIKEKNLGVSNPETLSQCGDIARLYRDQGRFAESQKLYEQTLASYRKLSNPGTTYATMLENYLDLLTCMKQASRADQIGREVTAYYKRTDVSSNN